MRVVLVGGGTGGHFYPLIAVAEELREREAQTGNLELFYIGPDAFDAPELARLNIRHVWCPAGKTRRYHSWRNIIDPFKTFFGFFIAVWKLFLIYPDVVMSKGGFTSVPVIFAASFLRIPIVIHESDSKPGRANKLAARFARYIAISYPEVAHFFPEEKTALTGIPLRKIFRDGGTAPKQLPNIKGNRPILFVTGGSLGAERINDLVLSALPELIKEYEIIHQVGKNNLSVIETTADTLLKDPAERAYYHPYGFMSAEDIEASFGLAVLVISRAGSTTIYEIAAHGIPSILIPIPEEISHDQRSNAYAYARAGAAIVMEEHNLTPHLLQAEIERIMADSTLLGSMQTKAREFARLDAGDKIADLLVGIANEH